MKRTPFPTIVIVAVSVAVLGSLALAQQDKYSLTVPGGLAFSEFRGYEGAVRKVVGIRGAISSNLRLSDQAARSIG